MVMPNNWAIHLMKNENETAAVATVLFADAVEDRAGLVIPD